MEEGCWYIRSHTESEQGLKHGSDSEESVKITLEREQKPADERYRLYQTFLQTELQHQEENKVY